VKPRRLRTPKPGTCRVCSCTDEHGCPEGCCWADAEQTLCSSCAGTPADLTYALRSLSKLRATQPKIALRSAIGIAKAAVARFDERSRQMLAALERQHLGRRRTKRRAA
jgi:hypothetical protein